MPSQQINLFSNEKEIQELVIQLHDIARRIENNGNPGQIGYDIRHIADKLSEQTRVGKPLKESLKEFNQIYQELKDE